MAVSLRNDGQKKNDIDLFNEKVASAMKVPTSFLYPDTEPRIIDSYNVEEMVKLVKDNDQRSVPPPAKKCSCCEQELPPKPRVPLKKILGHKDMEAMSKAWSNQLREKIKESKNKAQVKVYVDPYFEDWE